MKKLLASVSYSFNNFYGNLNSEGQIIFSAILFLIVVLCVLLLISYIIQHIKDKKALEKYKKEDIKENKKEEKIEEVQKEYEDKTEVLYTNEKTEVEDIAQRVSEALKEDAPITLTNFEEDQERTAIISIDELMEKAKELELIDDDEHTGVNYLEKYNLEPAEVDKVVSDTMKTEEKEVKAFKVSQVISPVYGIKKDFSDSNK